MKSDHKLYHEALINLWTNINYFLVEISIRMNEFTHAMHCQNPKMIKLCKYFILNLISMVNCYVQLDELGLVHECYKMIEYFSEAFFDQGDRFYKKCEASLHRIQRLFLTEYEEKCELLKFMEYVAKKKLKDRPGEVLFPEDDYRKKEIYGFIPKKIVKEKEEFKDFMLEELANLGVKIDPILGNGLEVEYEVEGDEENKEDIGETLKRNFSEKGSEFILNRFKSVYGSGRGSVRYENGENTEKEVQINENNYLRQDNLKKKNKIFEKLNGNNESSYLLKDDFFTSKIKNESKSTRLATSYTNFSTSYLNKSSRLNTYSSAKSKKSNLLTQNYDIKIEEFQPKKWTQRNNSATSRSFNLRKVVKNNKMKILSKSLGKFSIRNFKKKKRKCDRKYSKTCRNPKRPPEKLADFLTYTKYDEECKINLNYIRF